MKKFEKKSAGSMEHLRIRSGIYASAVTVLVLVTSGHTTQALTRRKQSKKEAAANDTAAE